MPLIYSVDKGMACKEAKVYQKRILLLLGKKWDRPYSEMVDYVRMIMGMANIRSNMVLLRGAWAKRREVPELEDAAAYGDVRERHLEW